MGCVNISYRTNVELQGYAADEPNKIIIANTQLILKKGCIDQPSSHDSITSHYPISPHLPMSSAADDVKDVKREQEKTDCHYAAMLSATHVICLLRKFRQYSAL